MRDRTEHEDETDDRAGQAQAAPSGQPGNQPSFVTATSAFLRVAPAAILAAQAAVLQRLVGQQQQVMVGVRVGVFRCQKADAPAS